MEYDILENSDLSRCLWVVTISNTPVEQAKSNIKTNMIDMMW